MPCDSKSASPPSVEIDLHGYHPVDICGELLAKMIQQAYEMGAERVRVVEPTPSKSLLEVL